MTRTLSIVLALAAVLAAPAAFAQSDNAALTDTKADHEENGRWYTAEDIPTFNIKADGTVDFPTYAGYMRYNAECFQCHGPDGAGGSYAPALMESVKRIDYYEFVNIVTNGKQEVNTASQLVMPVLGGNPNVMCYLDDIYTYLRARGMGDLPRGRPAKKDKKSDEYKALENACMGS